MSNASDPTDPYAWPSYGDLGGSGATPEDDTMPIGMPSLPTLTEPTATAAAPPAAPTQQLPPLVPPAVPPAPTAGLVAPVAPSTPNAYAAPASYSAPAPVAVGGYGIAPQYLSGGSASNGVAVTSLVMGILGLVSLVLVPVIGISIVGTVCSPLAIGFGLWGRSQIDKSPAVYGNRGMATAGFWLGVVGTVLAVLAVILVVAAIGLIVLIFSEAGY